MSERGHIVFTFCDREANEFVTLGQTDSMDPDTLAAFFAALPPPNDPDSPFLADLWSDGDCHDDDKAVSPLAIEQALGVPLDRLLHAGRQEISAFKERLAIRRAQKDPNHV